jgi:flagellar biosynthetic protein FliR
LEGTVAAILGNADAFVLIAFRTSGLIFSSPVFGRRNIPAIAKIALIGALSYLFFTILPPGELIEYNTFLGFVFTVLMELLLGVALAYITNIFFSVTFIAGHMIDMQLGFGIVNVYDPQNNTQIPMLGNLMNIILLIVFFAVNGHTRLIEILFLTFRSMPVGAITFSPQIGYAALEIFARCFTLGIMVAMPIIASGIVLEICFGLLMRTVPQLNMFVVGIPLKILVGFLMLMFTLPVFVGFSDRLFSEMFAAIERMFSTFAGG